MADTPVEPVPASAQVGLAGPHQLELVRAISERAGRRFAESDEPRISRHADDEPYGVEELAEYQRAGRLLVATEAEGRAVGFVMVDELDGRTHVEEVSVDLELQGRGLGRLLMDGVESWARDHGHREVSLTTFGDVPWNRPFYERLGYRVVATEDLTAPLARRLEIEAEAGLDPDLRVVMVKTLVTAAR